MLPYKKPYGGPVQKAIADLPGEYTIIASAGNHVAIQTVWVEPRNVKKLVEIVGQGRVADRKTSDL